MISGVRELLLDACINSTFNFGIDFYLHNFYFDYRYWSQAITLATGQNLRFGYSLSDVDLYIGFGVYSINDHTEDDNYSFYNYAFNNLGRGLVAPLNPTNYTVEMGLRYGLFKNGKVNIAYRYLSRYYFSNSSEHCLAFGLIFYL